MNNNLKIRHTEADKELCVIPFDEVKYVVDAIVYCGNRLSKKEFVCQSTRQEAFARGGEILGQYPDIKVTEVKPFLCAYFIAGPPEKIQQLSNLKELDLVIENKDNQVFMAAETNIARPSINL